MLTAELIRKLAPSARADYVDAMATGGVVFEQYAINTPERMAHFLAQVCHETGGLRIVRENMNYSSKRIREVWPTRPEAVKFAGDPQGLANCVYNGRMGNRKGSNDGWLFRGGGLLQTTGRDNYELLEEHTGLPFASKPATIEHAPHSLVAACWELTKFFQYCDMPGDRGLRAVCNGINRGNPASSLLPIGWADRQLWFQKSLNVLGICPAPVDDVLELGDHGEQVEAAQRRLAELGYAVGKIDGVFGSRVRVAVLAFQAENGLATDGQIGPVTQAALTGATAKRMPVGERANDTAADLKAAGSQTIATTDAMKTAAKVSGPVVTALVGADSTGLLDNTAKWVADANQFKGLAGEVTGILVWALTHWYYFAPLAVYLVYRWANTIEGRRVLEHNLGLNLSK